MVSSLNLAILLPTVKTDTDVEPGVRTLLRWQQGVKRQPISPGGQEVNVNVNASELRTENISHHWADVALQPSFCGLFHRSPASSTW